ncbi:hypothetical protein [Paenibacillus glufosinatiresistens]|uniref:hypothetical protein n=1 Tax=Paenibacillus glufosinatiresistens TaxID=3070657 RepID=UPI00286E0A74|nr:hypothetical protein [Paenibacillus sp. YX.27]
MDDPLFPIGRVVVTPRAMGMIGDYGVLFVICCHVNGNWGNVSKSDERLNTWAINNRERIISTYSGIWDRSVFVVTERDRSVTTILLGDEY